MTGRRPAGARSTGSPSRAAPRGPAAARRPVAVLAAVFLLALAIRVTYILQYRTSPFFYFPIIDSMMYDLMAWRYAQGAGLSDGAFFWPPLYPWMLGVFYSLFGHTLLGARLLQAMLGSFSCLLLYGIGRTVFGHTAGVASACVMAVYGTLVYFDAELLVPSLYIFLVLGCLLTLLHAARARPRVGLALWTAAGAILGLAALARPNILVLLPLAAVLGFGTVTTTRWWQKALRPLCFVVGALLVISVVTLRNYREAHDFVLISYNGGLNFYLGNNADAEQTVATRPGLAWVHLAGEPARAGIHAASASSRYFLRKGLSFLRQNPRAALSLYLEKFARFWDSFEIGRNQNVYSARRESSLLSLLLWRAGPFAFPFGIVAPLAGAGLIVCFSRDRIRLFLYAFLLAYMASVLLFFATARYRLAVVPILILFSVQYVLWVLGRLRTGRRRPVLWSLAAVLLLVPATNRGFSDADRIYGPEEDRYLGFNLHRQGRPAQAEEAYRRALARDSTYADVHAELGQLLLEEGRAGEALPHLAEAHRLVPFSAQTRYLLGTGYKALGRTAEAEALFRRALEVEPHASANQDLGILLLEAGRLRDAEGFLLEARRLLPQDVNAWYRLSECYYRQGDYAKAEDALAGALRLAPLDRAIQQNLRDLRRLRAQSGSSP